MTSNRASRLRRDLLTTTMNHSWTLIWPGQWPRPLICKKAEARVAKRIRVCGGRRRCKPACKVSFRHRPPNREPVPAASSNIDCPRCGHLPGPLHPAPISLISGPPHSINARRRRQDHCLSSENSAYPHYLPRVFSHRLTRSAHRRGCLLLSFSAALQFCSLC